MEFSCIRFDVLMVLNVKIGVSGRDDVQFCISVKFGAQKLNCVAGCVKCSISCHISSYAPAVDVFSCCPDLCLLFWVC